MTKNCMDALTNGKLIKTQSFTTPKGNYTLKFIRHKAEVYFFKYRDNTLIECCNLNQVRGDIHSHD